MAERKKIQILNAKYDEELNLLVWEVKFLDGGNNIRKLAFRLLDIGEALGLVGEITPELARKYLCEAMIGKEINLEMQAMNPEYPSSIQNASDEQIFRLTRFYHQFPFFEAQEFEKKDL